MKSNSICHHACIFILFFPAISAFPFAYRSRKFNVIQHNIEHVHQEGFILKEMKQKNPNWHDWHLKLRVKEKKTDNVKLKVIWNRYALTALVFCLSFFQPHSASGSTLTFLKEPEPITIRSENKFDYSMIDEAWGIVNKYYIDRTFNNQNWNDVLKDYKGKNGDAMELTSKMVASLGDKYSRVLDTDSYSRLQKFDLIGVGVTLMPNSQNGRMMVGAPPFPGSAADTAGIKKGDYVDAVNGILTKGKTSFDIIDQISEDPNSDKIDLTVSTPGDNGNDPKNEITRDLVLERTFSKVKDPITYKISERRSDGTVVGYIYISEFNTLLKRNLEAALKDLEMKGANAYVIDLRGNPGGAFQSAVEIASFFLDDAIATVVLDKDYAKLPFKTAKGKVIVEQNHPISLWVDARSASASEVFAGALHDNCRAVVMGDASYGKGLIQAVYGLQSGNGLVLTVARYITPNGTDIQGKGIEPDINSGVPGSILSKYITVINSDTSKVDFKAISSRSKELCAPQIVPSS